MFSHFTYFFQIESGVDDSDESNGPIDDINQADNQTLGVTTGETSQVPQKHDFTNSKFEEGREKTNIYTYISVYVIT